MPLLYDELVPWYRLVDPAEDHAEEVAIYRQALERGADRSPATLLELGAGAGHNAFHLKHRFRCTLTDMSAPMQRLSQELNPDCDHELGDMRTLRLGRLFDVVLAHDAIGYMTTEDDLAAAVRTAFEHTRPGGAALFTPDDIRETFSEGTELLEGEDGDRALRGIEWAWDPDPDDETVLVEYVFVLREGNVVRTVHDRHLEGVFARATWLRVLGGAGFEVEIVERALTDRHVDEMFLCRRR